MAKLVEVGQGASQREPRAQAVAKEPTAAERALHELTHWPYQQWCSHCVCMRGIEDRHVQLPESSDRDTPVVSFDFCYTGVSPPEGSSSEEEKLTILVAHDTSAGCVLGLPLPTKGNEDLKFAAVELTRYVQALGHNTISLQCDHEPSTLALQSLIVGVRTKLGYKTLVRDPAVGSHASNGHAEKTVDLLRGLSNVFLDQLRSKYNIDVGPSHPLMAWSYIHASFILNRFSVKGGATAYERCYGYRYSGKLAAFGEPVWGFKRGKAKGDRKWHRAMFVSKSVINDMYILMNEQGVWLTRSIRRNAKPWVEEKRLVENAKGYPWDYKYGVLGSKVIPQPRVRNPVAAEEADAVFEHRGQLEGSIAQPAPVATGPSSMAGMAGQSNAQASQASGLEVAGPSPMEVAASDPPTPMPPVPAIPHVEMKDSDLLIDVAERIKEAQMLAAGTPIRAAETPIDDRPPKFQRIARVGAEELPVNDEPLDEDSQMLLSEQTFDEEADFMLDSDWQVLEDDDAFWFPEVPDLDQEALAALDRQADYFEVMRLLRMRVLEQVDEHTDVSGHKELSSKFVRSWRKKKRNGQDMVYRRSRLCAREFRWLEKDREGLYSPATTACVTRLLPWLYCELWKNNEAADAEDDPWALLALDVKDAYLCVDQETPMAARIPGFEGMKMRFIKMIPGQRDGAAKWNKFIMDFLRQRHKLEICAECPSVYKVQGHPGLIHVDDLLLLARLSWLMRTLVPELKDKFKVSFEVACKTGDRFNFLKREHILCEEGIVIMPPREHALKMAQLLGVRATKTSSVPCSKELVGHDHSPALPADKAAAFRSAVGVGLYISNDRPDISFSVRVLAQWLRDPTELAWKCAQKLAAYVQSTASFGTLVHAGNTGESLLNPGSEGAFDLLETFTDSDWSGNKRNRRLMSCASYFINNTCLFTTCRTQKVVSLSSSEAEYYSLVSGAADALFIKAVLQFLLEKPIVLSMRLDNQAAKQLSHKQGCGKIRHMEGRYLWLQEKVAAKVLSVGSVDGELNPSDLGTKVPHGPSRLLALLNMRCMVEQIGETFKRVGVHEHEELVRKHESQKSSKQVRRVISKMLRQGAMTQPAVCMIILNLLNSVQAAGVPVSTAAADSVMVLESGNRSSMTLKFECIMMAVISGVMLSMIVSAMLHLHSEPVQGRHSKQPKVQACSGAQVGAGAQAGTGALRDPRTVELHVSAESVVQCMCSVIRRELATCVSMFTMSVKLLVISSFKYFVSLEPGYEEPDVRAVRNVTFQNDTMCEPVHARMNVVTKRDKTEKFHGLPLGQSRAEGPDQPGVQGHS